MGGELRIEIDGDLYKASVLLSVCSKNNDENENVSADGASAKELNE